MDDAKEYLLANDDETCSNEGVVIYRSRPQSNWLSRHKYVFVIIWASLFLPLVLNAYLLYRNLERQEQPKIKGVGRSPYAELESDSPTIYRAYTPYWPDHNETLSDELWDALDTDPGAVALSDEWVEEHGLESSARFPWDDQKGLYFIKAFHHVHCLKVIRKAFINYQRDYEQTIYAGHIHHCLDGLRQDVMCRADDTPMPMYYGDHQLGNNQVLQCRDLNKLAAWAYEPERHACHKILDDYKPVKHSLERHAFCPEGSPYSPVVKAYFEKHGHKNPYEE